MWLDSLPLGGSASPSTIAIGASSKAEFFRSAVREALRSRTALERNLNAHVRAFAYPYGASDSVIHHLVGACGYTFSLTRRSGTSEFHDSHLALPRLEIKGDDGLQEFAAKVGIVGQY
jgi:hypothetical protein